ncbi:MAG TPA: NAD(P)H-dependent glycerol-3-phosphate dehydrogenase [Novimethylophilus sp.]|jgi:glycerol-3-phosphate dehydrogenase (NAD(P)+)|uniref:NAD(P)H-dependent glycerol-3-phosphate dehydrogenase n=1 Tax=Novimethylophilus sp. TaxID=2137426 RepID=UPI002F3E233C
MKIAVLGAGAFGTSLAIHIARQHPVVMWTRNHEHLTAMRETRANRLYLEGFDFPAKLQLEGDLRAAMQQADLILSVVPTAGLRHVLREIRESGCRAPVVWACKGLEAFSAKLLFEVAADELPAGHACGALSGPSFAKELAAGLPTALTLASRDADFARDAAALLHANHLRVYSSNDVVGVAVGGALKNVIAIAAGICDGMSFGSNARAALITRGLAEITRFGIALGAKSETMMGLAGAGDLILTCTGDLSRNRQVGLRLARGETLDAILGGLGHVAEGVHTAREVCSRAHKLGIEMPITQQVHQVLSEGLAPRAAVENLLNREQKAEVY